MTESSSPPQQAPRKPRRGDELEVAIEAFDERGRGIGRAGGSRVRIRRALPGDRVRARVLKRRRDLVDAHLVEKIAQSAETVPATCPHFGSCGGCSLQDLGYSAQLDGLRQLVEDEFRARGLLADATVEPVVPAADPWRYRNKMEFTFASRRWISPDEPPDAPTGFALGLHAAGLHTKVVDIRTCAIQDPRADAILATARELALARGLAPWDLRRREGLLRHLVIRVARATGEVMVILVTSARADEEVGAFARALVERHPGITTFVQSVNTRPAATAQGEWERVLFGPGVIREDVGGLRFAISAGSFFQTNTAGAEVLMRIVREEAGLDGGEVVWDLYCGTGALALALARSAREVIGFELSPAAVADARRNAELNGIANARFLEGDVASATASSSLAPPDVCVVDPPRAGLHPRLIARLLALSPRRLVYVSCNPRTAAQDLERVVPWGWRIRRIRPVDLFPHTPHVECVIGVERRG